MDPFVVYICIYIVYINSLKFLNLGCEVDGSGSEFPVVGPHDHKDQQVVQQVGDRDPILSYAVRRVR